MDEREKLEQAIQALEGQRPALGDVAVDAAIAALKQQAAATDREVPAAIDFVGERKLVTIMFADLSGFTALSEKLDPEQVRALMNDCFNALVPVVEKYGGTVDKFIGDEIMALYGAPKAHERDAEYCLRAALEMMDVLKKFDQRSHCTLGMHIGINTGTVVSGGMGSEGRQQYSVLGDAVNLAARLEDASETGQILVGPNTYRLTCAAFEYQALPPVKIKGKSGLVPIYQLMAVKAGVDQRPGVAGLHSPMVGRAADFERLNAAVADLDAGHGSLVSLVGEPGIGKSRLVAEVRQSSPSDVRWVEGRAQSFTTGMAYWMAQSMLDGLLGIAADAAPAELAEALRSSLEALFPVRDEFDQVFPYLANLRGVPLDERSAEMLQHVLPEAIQSRTRAAFGAVVRALCHHQPLVMVGEDMHWADASSLGLLESLLPLLNELPLLFLCVFRPQEGAAQDWFARIGAAAPCTVQPVELAALPEADSRQLVENLLKIENLPPETRELILGKAEGNPFFLEEILRSLLETGLVLLEGDHAVAIGGIQQLEVPDTLQGVIAARVDRLPPEEKYTLQTASVIGRIFQQPVLAYLLERQPERQSLDVSLQDLQRRELIRHRMDFEYIFKHAVTQDVTYNSLLLARRKELHRVTAQAIESLFPDHLEELAPTLAYHYQRADSPEQAVHYSIIAAERARKSYANTEAIAFYRSALEQVQDCPQLQPEISGLHEKLGDIFTLIGQQEEARTEYEAALQDASRADGILQSRLRRKGGNTWMSERQYPRTLEACDLAETALGPASPDASPDWHREWLDIQLDRIWAYYWSGQVNEMIALVDRMRQDLDAWGTPLQRTRFYRSLIMVGWRRERFVTSEETLAYAFLAVDAARASGDQHEVAFVGTMLGMCQLWRMTLDEAETTLRRALDAADRIGDAETQILSCTYLTVTYRRKRQVEQTRHYARQSEALAEAAHMKLYVGVARANLAWAHWKCGETQDALREGKTALEILKDTPYPGTWITFWPLIATAVQLGLWEDAIQYGRELLKPGTMKMADEVVTALCTAVEAWESGDRKQAHSDLQIATKLAYQTLWL